MIIVGHQFAKHPRTSNHFCALTMNKSIRCEYTFRTKDRVYVIMNERAVCGAQVPLLCQYMALNNNLYFVNIIIANLASHKGVRQSHHIAPLSLEAGREHGIYLLFCQTHWYRTSRWNRKNRRWTLHCAHDREIRQFHGLRKAAKKKRKAHVSWDKHAPSKSTWPQFEYEKRSPTQIIRQLTTVLV